MLRLRVYELDFTYVGRRLVVTCSGGTQPQTHAVSSLDGPVDGVLGGLAGGLTGAIGDGYAGILFDVVHRSHGASWLWFRVQGAPVVLIVEDPRGTTVQVEHAHSDFTAVIPRPRNRERWWSRRALRDRNLPSSDYDPKSLTEPGADVRNGYRADNRVDDSADNTAADTVDDRGAGAGGLPPVGGVDWGPLASGSV